MFSWALSSDLKIRYRFHSVHQDEAREQEITDLSVFLFHDIDAIVVAAEYIKLALPTGLKHQSDYGCFGNNIPARTKCVVKK